MSSSSRRARDHVPLAVRMPPHYHNVLVTAEDENFSMLDEIIPHSEIYRSDFSTVFEDDLEISGSLMKETELAEFRAKCKTSSPYQSDSSGERCGTNIPPWVLCLLCIPLICRLILSYSPISGGVLLLLSRLPCQCASYTYKFICMLTKYAKLAGVGVSLRHLIHLFAPNFHRETILHLRHRGGKYLVVKMEIRQIVSFGSTTSTSKGHVGQCRRVP